MDTTRIKEGDIVRINVRGQNAYALVVEPTRYDERLHKRVLHVKSLTRVPIPTMWPTPRQIVGHWRRSRQNERNA